MTVKRLTPALCIVVLSIFAAGSAHAQNFSGFYVGAFAGDSVDRSVISTTTVFTSEGYFANSSVTAINSVGTQVFPLNGITGGGRVGWNFRWHHLVVGPEIDFGSLRLNASNPVTAGYPCCAPSTFTITQGIKTRGLFTARARVGATFGPVLLYLTGGGAVTDINSQEVFSDNFANAAENGGVKVDQAGWVVGGGGELAISRRWSLTGEFLYIDFGTAANTSTNLTAFSGEGDTVGGIHPLQSSGESFPSNIFTHSSSLIERMGRFGINFHF
jgi:outer membrane immunogenic protein